MHEGDKFFDNDKIFDTYRSRRHRTDGPNETLEKPVFLDLLDDIIDKHILDLGCGDGLFGLDLLSAGCHSFLGLESSPQMVELAQANLHETNGNVIHSRIEDWYFPPEKFDLVISRLALHYVANLDETFFKVNRSLKHNGQFVFSIVHPVITSCDKSRESDGIRQDWIVDDYFSTGPRQVRFMDDVVKQHHRTVEDIFNSLQNANFQIERLRESCPQKEHFSDMELYQRRKRIPLFLFLSGRKL